MITVNIGGLPICVDSTRLHALLGEKLQDAFDYSDMAPAKARIIRLGMKMLMRESLAMLDRARIQGKLPPDVPAPDWELADKDILTYGASFMFALALKDLEKQAFEADYHEGPNGEIILTGLHTAAALPPESFAGFLAGPSDNASEAPAAPGAVDATRHGDASPADPDTATGRAPGDSGQGGGYLDLGGDEGDRQDDGTPAADAQPVGGIP